MISDTQEDKSNLQIQNINHIFQLRIEKLNKKCRFSISYVRTSYNFSTN